MRRREWLATALVPAVLLLAGLACDENPAEPTDSGPSPGIVGTVLDADGIAVAGAPVGLIYGIYQGQVDWPPAEFGASARAPNPTGPRFTSR